MSIPGMECGRIPGCPDGLAKLLSMPDEFEDKDAYEESLREESLRARSEAAIAELAQALLDSVGPRLTGSPGLLNASNWIINKYKSWGIDAKHEQYGTWRGWRRGVSHIDLVSPRTRSKPARIARCCP